jgi:hypothetical protein
MLCSTTVWGPRDIVAQISIELGALKEEFFFATSENVFRKYSELSRKFDPVMLAKLKSGIADIIDKVNDRLRLSNFVKWVPT